MIAQVKEVTIAHSPDSDDAFMFYALAKEKLDKNGLVIHKIMKDIQTLNQEAIEDKYDVSAISFAAYPYVHDRYYLMPCGASMGDKYGPIVVANEAIKIDELSSCRIAVPGKLTTAFLTLNLFRTDLNTYEVPFERIIDEVRAGHYDAGLLIHEGQLTYKKLGLTKIIDLGEWWHEETGLPLPLGTNIISKDLEPQLIKQITKLMQDSIQYSLDHRKEALQYALDFAPEMPVELADRFIGMYVNELTIDCGERGRAAVRKLFEIANQRGLFDKPVAPEFTAS